MAKAQMSEMLRRACCCAAGIFVLYLPCSPAAVAWLVVAERVDAIKGQAGRARSHVIHEELEIVAPTIAHANALGSVVAVPAMSRVVTPGFGVLPSPILFGSVRRSSDACGVAVLGEACGHCGWESASAALRSSGRQCTDLQYALGATGARAEVFPEPALLADYPKPENEADDVASRRARPAKRLGTIASTRDGHSGSQTAASDGAFRSAVASTNPPVVSVVTARQVSCDHAQASEHPTDVINWLHQQILTLTRLES